MLSAWCSLCRLIPSKTGPNPLRLFQGAENSRNPGIKREEWLGFQEALWQAAGCGIKSRAAGRSTVPQAESRLLVTQRRMDGIEGLWKQLAATNLTSVIQTEALAQELLPLLASSPALGLPPSIKTALFPAPFSSSFTPRSGCNDAFSVFAFLAFLLALLQLMQDMARRRRKRGAEEVDGELVCQERGRQAAIAAHTMFQGG